MAFRNIRISTKSNSFHPLYCERVIAFPVFKIRNKARMSILPLLVKIVLEILAVADKQEVIKAI
jgi:hypothetical protein